MAKIESSAGVGGKFVDKKSLKNGDMVKIISEALWVEGQFGKQLVAKIRIKGQAEEVNAVISTPTRNAFISAYGDDSVGWIGKVATVAVESGIFAGKRGIMLNLVPEGYVVTEDAAGYIIIRPKVEPPAIVKKAINAEEGEAEFPIGNFPEGNEIPF